jgi:uncharacterized Zn-finger protein
MAAVHVWRTVEVTEDQAVKKCVYCGKVWKAPRAYRLPSWAVQRPLERLTCFTVSHTWRELETEGDEPVRQCVYCGKVSKKPPAREKRSAVVWRY